MLNFVYCLDKNYNIQALTSINSLIEKTSEIINIYIIHDEPDTFKLDNLTNTEKANLNLYKIDVNNIDFPNLTSAHVSRATYFRLYFSNFLPKDLDFVIYIDADILCLNDPIKDIKDIKNKLRTSNYKIAARTEVKRINKQISENSHFERLNLSGDNYFNAGVMVIDYQYWLNNQVEKQLLKIMDENFKEIKFWDQDILNKFFDSNYIELNENCNFDFGIYNLDKYDEIKILNNVIFLHYQGKGKPWNIQNITFDSSLIYQKEFRKLNLGYYHLVFYPKIKSLKFFLKYLFSFNFLNLEKPKIFLTQSIKSFLKFKV